MTTTNEQYKQTKCNKRNSWQPENIAQN